MLFLVLPLLVGLFWGAPLVAREVEQGTHRFAWTQGVSRRQWALVKFGFVGAVTVAAAVVYGLGMSWWAAPLSQAGQQGRFNVFFFDMQGVVPVGYTVFAVALGIFAGVFWPKVLPAMAVTLAGFTGLRIALTVLARPHYLPLRTRSIAIEGTGVELVNDKFRPKWWAREEPGPTEDQMSLCQPRLISPAGRRSPFATTRQKRSGSAWSRSDTSTPTLTRRSSRTQATR